jgi:hypothetical protein
MAKTKPRQKLDGQKWTFSFFKLCIPISFIDYIIQYFPSNFVKLRTTLCSNFSKNSPLKTKYLHKLYNILQTSYLFYLHKIYM